jgi:hypothetical protein
MNWLNDFVLITSDIVGYFYFKDHCHILLILNNCDGNYILSWKNGNQQYNFNTIYKLFL